MSPSNMVTVLDESQISPPPTVANLSLPLNFFDIPWLYLPPTLHVLFYEFHHSKANFMETIVPNLKHSLSVALKHFLPLAGNLIILTDSSRTSTSKHEIRYVEGDSVSLTFAECSKDFNYLTGNHARNAEEFRHLVPDLLPHPVSTASNSKIINVLAIQVTIFLNGGISIGISSHHTVGDASTFVNFTRAWASISKFQGDESFLASGSLPVYDRTLIKDPNSLATKFWNQVWEPVFAKFDLQPRHVSRPNLVRTTFIMSQDQIKRLKESATTRLQKSTPLSSFVIVCAYVWGCIAKVRALTCEVVDAVDEKEYSFICTADFRARLDPPIPSTYFGNCAVPCFASSRSSDLAGEDGFFKAVELIGEGISKRVNSKNAILEGMEEWMNSICSREKIITLGVAGSPNFDFYDTDFGWGKPKKSEIVSIDNGPLMSINSCKEPGRDVEISLCFSKTEMDVFAITFNNGLRSSTTLHVD